MRLQRGMLLAPAIEMVVKKTSIFLSHNHADKAFARRLATELTHAGAGVWIDDAEIKVGDSLIGKIEAGLIKSDYLGVILSPNSVASNWVKTELRAVLSQEITDAKVRVLPILHRECDVPLFLRDKLHANFCIGPFRKALAELLRAMGLGYSPVGRISKDIAFDPIAEAETRILGLGSEELIRLYSTALQLSILMPSIPNRPDLAIPDYIRAEFGISLEEQFKHRISLTRDDAHRYLRDIGRVLSSFIEPGLHKRYRQKFNRDPSTVWSGPEHHMFSYCELLEWFDIPEEISMPQALISYVDEQRLLPTAVGSVGLASRHT
jgi:TIR domain